MTLKHSPQQIKQLFNVFNEMVLLCHPSGFEDMLIQVHMIAIYRKLRTLWEGKLRKEYRLSLTEPEALAYYIFWAAAEAELSKLVYENNFITAHCGQIHQELTQLKKHNIHINKLLS